MITFFYLEYGTAVPSIYILRGGLAFDKCHNETTPRRPSVLDEAPFCMETWKSRLGDG